MSGLEIGPRLRAARRSADLTQAQLAKRLGRSQRWVLRREAGTSATTAADVKAWAEATGTDPRWLLDMGGDVPTVRVLE